jgi:hypothetical protein
LAAEGRERGRRRGRDVGRLWARGAAGLGAAGSSVQRASWRAAVV